MSMRQISFVPGEHYHLYNRGNSKQTIFYDETDYKHFLKLLYLCNSTKNFVIRDITSDPYEFDRVDTLVYIGAYCLMPNHFHILVREKTDGGISKFMQKLATAYVMYLNTRYERSGGLFEGKFKSKYIDIDKYLKYIFSYIHLNPVKLKDTDWKINILNNKKSKELENHLKDYKFSSFFDYVGNIRPEGKIISREVFPEYFKTPNEFIKEIRFWLTFNSEVDTEARPM